MELPAGIRPDERILILGVPAPSFVLAVAQRLSEGLVVVIGNADAVCEARKATSHLDNAMFVPGTPDELPWRDGFFTRVIDTVGTWPDAERVLSEISRVTKGT
jgi:hypothetical protein